MRQHNKYGSSSPNGRASSFFVDCTRMCMLHHVGANCSVNTRNVLCHFSTTDALSASMYRSCAERASSTSCSRWLTRCLTASPIQHQRWFAQVHRYMPQYIARILERMHSLAFALLAQSLAIESPGCSSSRPANDGCFLQVAFSRSCQKLCNAIRQTSSQAQSLERMPPALAFKIGHLLPPLFG